MKVRIEPMNENNETFKEMDIKQVQLSYFMKTLPYEQLGWYWYESHGLKANENDLILFQMKNSIIASAKYDDKLKETTPAFKIKPNTIRIFKPIDREEMSSIIPGFTRFGMVRWNYDETDVNMELLEQRMSIPIDN